MKVKHILHALKSFDAESEVIFTHDDVELYNMNTVQERSDTYINPYDEDGNDKKLTEMLTEDDHPTLYIRLD